MSACFLASDKRSATPVATGALLLAAVLTAQASQDIDFSRLSFSRADPRPIPALVAAGSTHAPARLVESAARSQDSTVHAPSQKPPTDTPGTVKSTLGIVAGLLGLAGAGFYVAQTIRNGTTTKMGWAIIAVTETLIGATSWTLGSIVNFWAPLAFSLGSYVACAAAFKYGKSEPLGKIDKFALGFALAGWGALIANAHNPVVAAVAAQVAYQASDLSFVPMLYGSPRQICTLGQMLYLASAALNLIAMNTIAFPASVSPIGYFLGIAVCTGALLLGHMRERRRPNSTF